MHYNIYSAEDVFYWRDIKSKYICLAWNSKEIIEKSNTHICYTLDDLDFWMNEKDDFEIIGFWMNEQYLKEQVINKMIKPSFESSFLEKFLKETDGKNIVGVHIRRGDFLSFSWTTKLDAEYYKAAICWFKKNIGECKFFFFSNDIEWAKQELGCDSSYYFIESLAGIDGDVEEFLCLLHCKYMILSNSSTFSSLAFALNSNKQKIKVLYESKENIDNLINSNDSYFLYTYADKEYIKYLSMQEVEEWSKEYEVNGIYQGLNYNQIQYLETKKIKNKKEAEEWIDLCDNLSLNSYNIGEKQKRQIKLKKLEALIKNEKYGKANVLASRISYLEMMNPLFIQYYAEVLLKCGSFWGAIVELVRYRYLCNDISYVESYIKDTSIIDRLSNVDKYAFYVFPSELPSLFAQSYDAVTVGFILNRLGNELSFVLNSNIMR